MIIKEFYKTRKDGVNIFKTYSDSGKMIQKTNTEEKYKVAFDIESAEYEYIEIDDNLNSSENE